MKRLLWNIMATVSLLIMTIGCGTNEEGGENGEELTFTLTSTDLNCNTSKDIRVNSQCIGKNCMECSGRKWRPGYCIPFR